MKDELADSILREMGRLAALHLWRLGAIKVNLDKPFRLVSGKYSPIYINCRQLISAPAFADLFVASARLICERHRVEFDVVAGGETAGIAFAAFVARALGLPMIYVRKEAKGHGLASRIEGCLSPGSRVLLVEDLITDAGSKIGFIQGISEAEGHVKDVLVVFDRIQGGREALSSQGIALHALTDMDTALRAAEASGLLTDGQLREVREYLQSPDDWHRTRGLPVLD